MNTAYGKVYSFIALMRLARPVGILLLLWPTYLALWLAFSGSVPFNLLIYFTLGVVIMRSAGCVINDFADRSLDCYVKRTCIRPLTTGKVTNNQAIWLFSALCILACWLLMQMNLTTIRLGVLALGLIILYPYSKRWFYMPQLLLAICFSWPILMVYSAANLQLGASAYGLFISNVFWTLAYDSWYALADIQDDKQLGVYSSAIWLKQNINPMMCVCYFCCWLAYCVSLLSANYGLGICVVSTIPFVLLCWRHPPWRAYQAHNPIQAFIANQWLGASLWFILIIFQKIHQFI